MRYFLLQKSMVNCIWLLALLSSCNQLSNDSGNQPFEEALIKLPGVLQCERYDIGGEGIAYHDMDSTNNGSGNLNTGADFLSTFRKDEAVDISYTKFRDDIDNSIYNLVEPKPNQLYVGWTEPGEWTRYTVAVGQRGLYSIDIMYTSNQGGTVELSSNLGNSTGPMKILSTFNENDSIEWRQWHHWNLQKSIGTIFLDKGKHVLTLKTLEKGQMNYDYLAFTLKNDKE